MVPLYDTIVGRTPPIMTWILIGVNGLVFYMQISLPREELELLIQTYGVVPARFSDPHLAHGTTLIHVILPLVTSMFLHGGLMHVIGNMWTLWIFGDNVEDRMGPWRFLMFYLLCGILSAIAHIIFSLRSEHALIPTIGASGAVAGVMGAYLIMFPRSRIIVLVPLLFLPFFFEFPAILYLGYWFLLQLLSSVAATHAPAGAMNIAYLAHVGGFLAGVVSYGGFLRPAGERRPPEPDERGLRSAW